MPKRMMTVAENKASIQRSLEIIMKTMQGMADSPGKRQILKDYADNDDSIVGQIASACLAMYEQASENAE